MLIYISKPDISRFHTFLCKKEIFQINENTNLKINIYFKQNKENWNEMKGLKILNFYYKIIKMILLITITLESTNVF